MNSHITSGFTKDRSLLWGRDFATARALIKPLGFRRCMGIYPFCGSGQLVQLCCPSLELEQIGG